MNKNDLKIKDIGPIKQFQVDMVNNDCNRCHLGPTCRERDRYPVASSGLGRIMFIGHAPGDNEMRQGVPFVGEAGRDLKKLIRNYLGLDAEQHCYLTNAVKCFSGKTTVTKSQMACAPYLMKEINLVDPLLIVFLGKEATKNVVHPNDLPGIGNAFSTLIAGKIRDCFVMYHTALILRSSKMEKAVLNHMRKLGEITQERFGLSGPKTPSVSEDKTKEGRDYVLVNTLKGLREMHADLLQYQRIGLDTEATSLQVWKDDFSLVGVSLAGCTSRGYYIPVGHIHLDKGLTTSSVSQLSWKDVKSTLADLFITRKKQSVFHNYAYDYRVLQKNGLIIDNRYHDSMIMAYLDNENVHSISLKEQMALRFREQPQKYADVLAGDKNLAYKDPEDVLPYAVDDAINSLRVFNHALERVQKQSDALTDQMLLRYIYPQELKVSRIMSNAHMRGLCIDTEYLTHLRRTTTQDLMEVSKTIDAVCNLVEPTSSTQITTLIRKVLSDFPVNNFEAKIGQLSARKDILLPLVIWYKDQYNAIEPEERKSSWWTPAKLKSFIDGIVTFKRIHKVLSTYIDPAIALSQRGPEGNVLHPEFLTIGTTSGRMSCEKPNVQNLPREYGSTPVKCDHCNHSFDNKVDYKADVTGSRFTCIKCGKITKTYRYDLRKAFVARPNYRLLLSDFVNMEVIVTACVSGDTNLYNVIKKKLADPNDPEGDMHLVTAAKMFKTTPAKIKAQIESSQPYRATKGKGMRQAAKATVFGAIYGISKYGLHQSFAEQNLDYSVDDCQRFLDVFFDTYPKVKKWWDDSRRYLQVKHHAVNMFGRVRHVSKRANNSELRSAINFLVQGACAQITKQALVDLDEHFKDDPEVNILNMVHDEVVIECPMKVQEDVARTVHNIMQRMIKDKIEVFLPADTKTGARNLSKAAEETENE